MAELRLAKQKSTASGGCACVYSTNPGGRQTDESSIVYTQAEPCPCPEVYPGDNSTVNALSDLSNDNALRQKNKNLNNSESSVLKELSSYYRSFKNVAASEFKKLKSQLAKEGKSILSISKKDIQKRSTVKKDSFNGLRQVSSMESRIKLMSNPKNLIRLTEVLAAGKPLNFQQKKPFISQNIKNEKSTSDRISLHQEAFERYESNVQAGVQETQNIQTSLSEQSVSAPRPSSSAERDRSEEAVRRKQYEQELKRRELDRARARGEVKTPSKGY